MHGALLTNTPPCMSIHNSPPLQHDGNVQKHNICDFQPRLHWFFLSSQPTMQKPGLKVYLDEAIALHFPNPLLDKKKSSQKVQSNKY